MRGGTTFRQVLIVPPAVGVCQVLIVPPAAAFCQVLIVPLVVRVCQVLIVPLVFYGLFVSRNNNLAAFNS